MSRDWEGERRREGRTEKEMELARRSAPRSKDRGQDCSSAVEVESGTLSSGIFHFMLTSSYPHFHISSSVLFIQFLQLSNITFHTSRRVEMKAEQSGNPCQRSTS